MSETFSAPDGLRVLDRLSETSLGVFYRAEYLDSHEEVELVMLRPRDMGSESIARLRDQLHRAARIEHPNVASVRATGETDEGVPWVAFNVFQGELLSETLSARDRFPPSEAIELILQAASGMQAAHEVGLVHGNLSPDTILVTRAGNDRPLVKLIGFGLIHHGAAPSGAGAEGSSYAAPERLAGQLPDERSDVFGLGAVLHHLLTGAPPSAGRDGALPIPEAARRVLAKALEAPPDDRFQTVAAFARALTSATSRPPARVRSGARHASRLWGFLAIAVVVAIAIPMLWWGAEPFKPGGIGDEAMGAGEPITTGEVRESPSDEVDRAGAAASSRPPDDGAAADSTLVDVRSIDRTIQVDLRYSTANNFTGAPLPGYDTARALLRPAAAAALGRVQARLRSKGLGLKVYDAYRPERASRAMVDWAERTGRRELLASGYIARRSRHNLGVAVDLTMVDLRTGNEVPMGSTFDNFTVADDQPGDAGGEAFGHRRMLAEAMQSEGFSPYGGAWWHFNYPVEGAVPLDRVIR